MVRKMSHARPGLTTCSRYDAACTPCRRRASAGPKPPVNRRLALLRQIRNALAGIAPAWVAAAARRPRAAGGAIRWRGRSGWRALRANGRTADIATLEQLEEDLSAADPAAGAGGRPPGAAGGARHTLWDRLLLSGVRAEIWMQPGVTGPSRPLAGAGIRHPPAARRGKLALVLGAGNGWPRLRHWMCYTSCLLRIGSAC